MQGSGVRVIFPGSVRELQLQRAERKDRWEALSWFSVDCPLTVRSFLHFGWAGGTLTFPLPCTGCEGWGEGEYLNRQDFVSICCCARTATLGFGCKPPLSKKVSSFFKVDCWFLLFPRQGQWPGGRIAQCGEDQAPFLRRHSLLLYQKKH